MTRSSIRRAPRGVTAVLVAILIAALAAFLALVINSGHGFLVRSELQNATDAGALAGVRELNGTAAGIAQARNFATQYASAHETDNGMSVDVTRQEDIEFGNWNGSAFSLIDTAAASAAQLRMVNAIRVQAGRDTEHQSRLPVAMGPILNTNAVDVRAASIAVCGGPCRNACSIPLAFAECMVVDADGNLRCGDTLTFQSSLEDTIGFTNLTDGSSAGGASLFEKMLQGAISGDSTYCRSTKVGDHIAVKNGVPLNKMEDEFQTIADLNIDVTAPIVRTAGETCAKFTDTGANLAEVVGFATFHITGVTVSGSTKTITIVPQCGKVEPEPTTGGCEFFGTNTQDVRLVR